MSKLSDLEIENIDLIVRALDYYSKSLKNLEEYEIDESIPLSNGQVESSLQEVELIKEALKTGTDSYLNFVSKKLDFIVRILKFYGSELSEDLEELDSNDEHNIKVLQKEIEKTNEMIQLL